MTAKKPLVALVVLAAAVSVSCGSTDPSASGSGRGHSDHSMAGKDHDSGKQTGDVPGMAAQPPDADREITVGALDELRFDPAEIELQAGEVVTFIVQNEGKTDHEFVLGDAEYQEQHKGEMQEGHDMTDLRNAVTVRPGETAELTWRFDEPGAVLFGCHEPGHYDGGMVGKITVS